MYGLVNKAVEGFVKQELGDDAWSAVCAKAGIQDLGFISMDSYDDQVTYDLVGAASELTGLEANTILEGFGRYWMLYTAEEGYGALLDMTGSNIHEFLENLNGMHSRIRTTFEGLKPPDFECTDVTDTTLLLHYRTFRPGLAPMAIGILHGLAERLNQKITVEHRDKAAEGADHDTFYIEVIG